MADKAARSILAPAIIDSRVIPNGVDTRVFKPADRRLARQALHLPEDPPILLVAANGIRNNPFKDYQSLRAAIGQVAEGCSTPLLLIALGESAAEERIGQVRIQFVAHTSDPALVARYYQAADLYLHAARAETFPNAILEALACGTPAIATAVGGIPEQIDPGVTGILVPPGDSQGLAEAIRALLDDPTRRAHLGAAAADSARARFGLDLQTDRFLDWYGGILDMSQRHLKSRPGSIRP